MINTDGLNGELYGPEVTFKLDCTYENLVEILDDIGLLMKKIIEVPLEKEIYLEYASGFRKTIEYAKKDIGEKRNPGILVDNFCGTRLLWVDLGIFGENPTLRIANNYIRDKVTYNRWYREGDKDSKSTVEYHENAIKIVMEFLDEKGIKYTME